MGLLLELDGEGTLALEQGQARQQVQSHGLRLAVLEGLAVQQRALQHLARRRHVSLLHLELCLPHPYFVPAQRPQHLDVGGLNAADNGPVLRLVEVAGAPPRAPRTPALA